MKKSAVKIKIEKRYPLFRNEAKSLLNKVKSKDVKAISLDFAKVNFMSRSFIDEFLNIIDILKHKKVTVRIANLKPELKKFLTKVKKTKEKMQKER